MFNDTVKYGSSRYCFSYDNPDGTRINSESYTTLINSEGKKNIVLIFILDKTQEAEYERVKKQLAAFYTAYDFVGLIDDNTEKINALFERDLSNEKISKELIYSFVKYPPFVEFYYVVKKKKDDKDFRQASKVFVLDIGNDRKINFEISLSNYGNSLLFCSRFITIQ